MPQESASPVATCWRTRTLMLGSSKVALCQLATGVLTRHNTRPLVSVRDIDGTNQSC